MGKCDDSSPSVQTYDVFFSKTMSGVPNMTDSQHKITALESWLKNDVKYSIFKELPNLFVNNEEIGWDIDSVEDLIQIISTYCTLHKKYKGNHLKIKEKAKQSLSSNHIHANQLQTNKGLKPFKNVLLRQEAMEDIIKIFPTLENKLKKNNKNVSVIQKKKVIIINNVRICV